MSFSFTRFLKGLNIREENTTTPKEIDITPGGSAGTKTTITTAQTANRTITVPDATDTLVGKATTDTLTNKSIDADQNTITNIENADIKAGAAIDATKIADGSVTNTEFQYLGNVTSDIQTQLTTNSTGLSDHLADTVDAHDASAISFVAGGTISSTDVQSAVSEVATDAASALTTHASTASGVHGVTGNIVGTTDTQTLTNKTISGASNTLTNIPANTALTNQVPIAIGGTGASTQTAGFNALSPLTTKGDIIVHDGTNNIRQAVGTDGQVLVADSSQTSGIKFAAITGVKNYITNEGGESTVSGYSTFADGASLVDGTGGSPTATIARSTSSPLRGTASLLYTPGALGNGVSFDFTIDDADKAKVLYISMDYQLSGTITEGDYQCYIYDRTNGLLIQPAGYKFSGTSGTNYSLRASFQTASNSTSYRLIIYQSVSTSVTLKFDNVVVGPSTVTIGGYVGDWTSYTPTISATTSAPTKGTIAVDAARWRRVGDSMEIQYNYRQTTAGTAGTGTYLISIPSGYTIDSNKTFVGTSTNNPVGTFQVGAGTQSGAGVAIAYSSTQIAGAYSNDVNAYNYWSSSLGAFTNTNLDFGIHVTVPITGWGTSQQLSSESSEGRVVAAALSTSGQTVTTGSDQRIQFTIAEADTHGQTTTGSSAKITIVVPGLYQISSAANFTYQSWTINDGVILKVKKNGSTQIAYSSWGAPATTSYIAGLNTTNIVQLNAGDYIEAYLNVTRAGGNPTLNGSAGNYLTVQRISGSNQIASSETVVASYKTSAAQSFANNTLDIINFGTKEFDSHNAVTTGVGAWKFTAPVSGTYRVSGNIKFDNGFGWAAGEIAAVYIYKNTSSYRRRENIQTATHSTWVTVEFTFTIKLLAGEYVQLQGFQNSGGAATLAASADANYVDIERTGNY